MQLLPTLLLMTAHAKVAMRPILVDSTFDFCPRSCRFPFTYIDFMTCVDEAPPDCVGEVWMHNSGTTDICDASTSSGLRAVFANAPVVWMQGRLNLIGAPYLTELDHNDDSEPAVLFVRFTDKIPVTCLLYLSDLAQVEDPFNSEDCGLPSHSLSNSPTLKLTKTAEYGVIAAKDYGMVKLSSPWLAVWSSGNCNNIGVSSASWHAIASATWIGGNEAAPGWPS
eukprot:Gregarina_sp_Poly_1__37@NODE_1008_length_5371_cov_562_398190_g706_i0_p4_GENE_NODE_1008_length_5371_cov_562_398190_g706_i0NODE_1008_length_5371_cov_562_398190_g706_i0_p4_ORF_typecomplete_len224_score15_01_NODE_1008_length_5371_cov_562_398190_g706_i034694140